MRFSDFLLAMQGSAIRECLVYFGEESRQRIWFNVDDSRQVIVEKEGRSPYDSGDACPGEWYRRETIPISSGTADMLIGLAIKASGKVSEVFSDQYLQHGPGSLEPVANVTGFFENGENAVSHGQIVGRLVASEALSSGAARRYRVAYATSTGCFEDPFRSYVRMRSAEVVADLFEEGVKLSYDEETGSVFLMPDALEQAASPRP